MRLPFIPPCTNRLFQHGYRMPFFTSYTYWNIVPGKSIATPRQLSRTTSCRLLSTNADEHIMKCPYRYGDNVIPVPQGNYAEILTNKWLQYGSRTALTEAFSDRTVTFTKLYDDVMKVAAGWRKENLQKGDIVAIMATNSINYFILYVATILVGGVITTLNPAFKRREIIHCLQMSRPKYVATDTALVDQVRGSLQHMNHTAKVITLSGSEDGCMSLDQLMSKDWSGDNLSATVDPMDDVCNLPYSSGTTGLPKGVMLTHNNIMSQLTLYGVPEVSPLTPDVTVSCILPIYHIYGQITVVANSLYNGSNVIMFDRYEPDTFLEGIEKYRMNFLYIVPPLLLLGKSDLPKRFDLSSAKYGLVGAAPCSEEALNRFQEQFQLESFRQGYGLTETTSVTHTNILNESKLTTIGPCAQGVESKVVDVETGKNLPANRSGELCVRGGNIMKGYYKNPAATAECLKPDGWLHTGDIGYYDDNGHFRIIDRLKELIKYKGFQVAPAELEDLLLTHPAIRDAAVIGIPSEEAGEVPRAYVVTKEMSNTTTEDVIVYVKENAAPYKHLRGGVTFVKEIPKSPSGKILRRVLRDELEHK